MHIPVYNSVDKQNENHRRNHSRATDLSIVLFFILVIFVTLFLSTYQLAVKLVDTVKNTADTQNKTVIIINRAKQFLDNPIRGLSYTEGLIGWSNQVLINQLQLSRVNDVVIGKNGWLFVDMNGSLDDYRGVLRYTDQELAAFNAALEGRKNWLSKQNVPLLLVIVPNKESIYPEFLPADIKKANESSRLDQLINYLKLNSNVDLLDLRKLLMHEKEHYPLYYRTDSHWNSYGAYFGYSEIMKKVKFYFPGIEAYPIADYEEKVDTLPKAGDLAGLIMMEDSYTERRFHLEKTGNKGDITSVKIRSAVIYGDSFYGELKPFLSQHIDRILEFNSEIPFDQCIIGEEKPDIVIYIMVERLVPYYFLHLTSGKSG